MPTVRPARLEDMDRVYEITGAAFGPFCIAKLLEDRFGLVEGKGWLEHKGGSVVDAFKRRLDCVIVTEVEGQVAGYASFGIKAQVGMVGNNAVDPAFQGRGIGTRQIRTVLDMMTDRGAKQFVVTTMRHDCPARRVYEKCGFKLVRRGLQFVRKQGDGVERKLVSNEAQDERERLEADGFELIAETVRYEMTLADYLSATAKIDAQ